MSLLATYTILEKGLFKLFPILGFYLFFNYGVKKQRHHFAGKGLSSQSYAFSSSHVGCENWTIKKAECQRIDAFELRSEDS